MNQAQHYAKAEEYLAEAEKTVEGESQIRGLAVDRLVRLAEAHARLATYVAPCAHGIVGFCSECVKVAVTNPIVLALKTKVP